MPIIPRAIPLSKELKSRFWQNVRKLKSHWVFTMTRLDGYGQLKVNVDGAWQHRLAHRVSWVIHHGPIRGNQFVLHKQICTRRDCVNPDHLYLGNHTDNARDCIEMGRHHPLASKGELNLHAKLTEQDVQAIRRLHASGAVQRRIAEKYGVDRNTVYWIVCRRSWKHLPETKLIPQKREDGMNERHTLKGALHPGAKLTEQDVLKIRKMHASGVMQRVIAEKYGIAQGNVWRIVYRHSWKHLPGVMPVFRPRIKLTEQDVFEIRKLHASGMTQKAIAEKYGITKSTAWGIVRRYRWKHLP
jgi:hypothetical protein